MIGLRTRSSLLYISVYPFPWYFSFIHLLTVCEVALLCYYLTVILVWLSGYTSVSINKVILRWAQLVLGWVTVSWDQLPVQKNPSQYITSHSGQLSLAIPPWAGVISTSQRVMLCRWGVKAGIVCEWVAGKTVLTGLLTWAVSERFINLFNQ